jgi:dTDP-glucose pyrophosphorylase
MKKEYLIYSINMNKSIIDAMQQMDMINSKLLIVTTEHDKFFSMLSVGDVQRAIINNKPLDTGINTILRSDIRIATIHNKLSVVKSRMREKRNEYMPVIDDENNVVNIIFWKDVFKEKRILEKINLPVVIMAGGKGSRLKPLTNVIPKPLIPINDKTIIEDIMDRFTDFDCSQFYISVNYKADMIRYYLESLNNTNYKLEYFQEDKPLGTAGSLSLLKGKIRSTFFVSNCDILIDQDYSEILKYHRSSKNEITLVAAIKIFSIPYGTLDTAENGKLIGLTEKPELSFLINSGMYIIEPEVLNEIPNNRFMHITELIDKVRERNGSVGVFPVSEKSWKDIGSLTEYKFGEN